MGESGVEGRVIALTGAGGRLGGVVTGKLLDAGATVAAIDVREIEGLSEGATSFVADLTDEDSVADTFSRIEQDLGPLGGLIHTVGMWGSAPLAETELADWDTMLKVSLTTTFLCFREAARKFADGPGHLVAIASKQGADGGVASQGPYSAAKAGVVRLVESAAAEYDSRITAAAVAPSMILFGDEEPGTKGVSVDAVADLCVYLAGEGGTIHNGEVVRSYGTLR